MIQQFLVCILTILILIAAHISQAGEYAINEQFESLDEWVPVIFPKIENHTVYDIMKADGGSFLITRSKGSASGIRYTKEFNVYDYPVARWRWKIENVFDKGNVEEKKGDDYPMRVYFIFKYDAEKAQLSEKVKYGLAKLVYGEYPPQSSLNYIWANKSHKKRVYTSTYTDKSQMIILQAGNLKTGKWIEEQVNIVEDYRQAFGVLPPETASIAIMNDSDNTGEQGVSFMDYIQVLRRE